MLPFNHPDVFKEIKTEHKQEILEVFALLHLKSCCIPRDSRMFDSRPSPLILLGDLKVYMFSESLREVMICLKCLSTFGVFFNYIINCRSFNFIKHSTEVPAKQFNFTVSKVSVFRQ